MRRIGEALTREGSGTLKHPQKVLRVELVERSPRHVFHTRLEAGDGVAATLGVRVVAREQIDFVAGLLDQARDILEYKGREGHLRGDLF